MSDKEYDQLVQSMKDNGYWSDEPVLVTSECEVVDGWHRLQASADAGVDPTIVELDAAEHDPSWIAGYVISKHAARRNLTKAEIAKRVIATEKTVGKKVAPKGRPDKKALEEGIITAASVAKKGKVSEATARRALEKERERENPETARKRAEKKAQSARRRVENDEADTLAHYKELAETQADRVQELELIISKADLGDLKAEWKRAVANNKKRIATLTGQNAKLRQRIKDAEAEAAHYKTYAAEMEAALKRMSGGQ